MTDTLQGIRERHPKVCAFRFDNRSPCHAIEGHDIHHGAWKGREPNHDYVPGPPIDATVATLLDMLDAATALVVRQQGIVSDNERAARADAERLAAALEDIRWPVRRQDVDCWCGMGGDENAGHLRKCDRARAVLAAHRKLTEGGGT